MSTATLCELRSILGDRMLGELVGLPTAAFEEMDGSTLPPEVADRITHVGQVVWCLMGTYDDEGIRRWYERRRPQLRGKSPAEHLGPDWLADSLLAKRVLDLAKVLISQC